MNVLIGTLRASQSLNLPFSGKLLRAGSPVFNHPVMTALQGSWRFFANKAAHRLWSLNACKATPLLNDLAGLPYYIGRDENDVLRGANPPWFYISDFLAGESVPCAEKKSEILARLAVLPANVAFAFECSPRLKDKNIVIDALKQAGFTHSTKKTYTYFAPKGTDILAQIKSDTRNKVRAAMRELEIVPLSIDEFLDFYESNLTGAGKNSYFSLKIDREILEHGSKMDPSQVHILAARRKVTKETPGPHPVEAAFVCTGGMDGFLKLMRITYRSERPGLSAPHKHAVKFLVYESMRLALEMGLTLDTDGCTPGGEILYSRFGVFDTEIRDEFKRKTVQTVIYRFLPRWLRF
jgi:hypothetical protein